LELLANGVAQQNLSPIQTSQMEILFPPENLLLLFAEICEPVIDEILMLYQQNVILRQTRDLLLPRLISGELDVSDLDIAVNDKGGN
jgi:type I restriction enzyme S subunit